MRLQRFDPYDVVAEAGLSKALTLFASVATEWSGLVRDYRDAPPEEEEGDSSVDGNHFGFRV